MLNASSPAQPVPVPDWADELARAFAAAGRAIPLPSAADKDGDIAFSRLLQPVVAYHLALVTNQHPGLTPTIRELLAATLLRRLSSLCGRAFAEDFDGTRPAGATLALRLGAMPAESMRGTAVYEAWCRRHLDNGLRDLLARFPPLGRLIVVLCRQWRNNADTLLRRLDTDRELLATQFGIPREASLTGIDWDMSDPHRGGQQVALLRFGEGDEVTRLVYKPKDLRIEALFQQMVADVGQWIDDPFCPDLTIAACGSSYGYASFIEGRPCADAAGLRAFYRNAGRLLAILHLLGATDAHCGNLIASGTSLYLIDAETLFQGRTAPVPDTATTGPAHALDRLNTSVLRCGMLPVWTLVGEAQRAVDISALGAESSIAPMKTSDWIHVNTDAMVRGEIERHPSHPPSLPVPAGTFNPLTAHADELEAGFDEVYRLAMRPPYRAQLLDAVRAFTGLTRRVVLRATRVYALIQESALSPPALASEPARARILEKLARRSRMETGQDAYRHIYHAERHDMENLDIPYFEHVLGEETVLATTGPLTGVHPGHGLSEAIERIDVLCDQDLAWQKRLISAAIRARYLIMNRSSGASAYTGEEPPPVETFDPGKIAIDIATMLEGAALHDGQHDRTWLTLALLPDGVHVQVRPMGDGLYDGLAGLTVFWFILAACGAPQFLPPATQALTVQLERIRNVDTYTRYRILRDAGLGWHGLAGWLRLLQMPWVARGCAGLLDPAQEVDRLLADMPVELIRRSHTLDVLSGVAGLMLPVARHHQQNPGELSARILREAAGRLTATQLPGGGWSSAIARKPLTGLSHGASGMGLALIEAGTALSDTSLIDAGVRAFDYERTLFDPKEGNWPDVRAFPGAREEDPAFMIAWCHGAPGIGLARLRALTLLPDHPHAADWRDELDIAMRTTAERSLGNADHLCCGNLGRAAILRIAGQFTGCSAWVADAGAITRRVVARAQARGGFQLPHNDPGTTGFTSPGLMDGIAGIGAHLALTNTSDHLASLLV